MVKRCQLNLTKLAPDLIRIFIFEVKDDYTLKNIEPFIKSFYPGPYRFIEWHDIDNSNTVTIEINDDDLMQILKLDPNFLDCLENLE